MKKPVLSILVPTFEGSKRISGLFNSLNSLGYVHNPNCEIIVSDNGSSDECVQQLKDLSNSNKISLLQNQINLGFSANCIRLLIRAHGRFTWIIGDDDVVQIDALTLIALLNEINEDSILVCQEDYEYIISNVVSPNIPFGFIANVIQPNSKDFLLSMVEHSYSIDGHNSPQFFARWELFNQLGSDSLVLLSSPLLAQSQKSHSSNLITIFIQLMNSCARALSSVNVSWNWYCAYKDCLTLPNFSTPRRMIRSSFISILSADFRRSPFSFALVTICMFPRILLQDFGYGIFYLKVIYKVVCTRFVAR